MNIELGDYYLKNKKEFQGENGHEKLLVGLKKLEPIQTDSLIVGIDVGCCIGKYITNIQDICSESNKEILCFEPNPVNIVKLEEKIIKLDPELKLKLKLFKNCISNQTIITPFYNFINKKENSAGNGLAGLRSGGEKICDIEVKELDDILDNEYGNKDILIKFIKIDTEGNDTNVIKSMKKYLCKTKYIIFECSNCLDDNRGPGIKNPMKDIVDFLSNNGFDVYRIGTKKLIKVNDEYWNDVYEQVKFWSNCFAIQKDDTSIHQLINSAFDYTF